MQTGLHPFVSAAHRHNPHQRAVLLEHDSWLVLLHPRNCPEFAQRSAGGRLALQLWNRREQLSILGPSAETNFSYEVFPINDEAIRLQCYKSVTSLLKEYGMTGLPEQLVEDMYACFVLSSFIGASPVRAPG